MSKGAKSLTNATQRRRAGTSRTDRGVTKCGHPDLTAGSCLASLDRGKDKTR